jgi:protein-S-isoprenylcysteine O-methyltransferase Ste14
MEDARDLIRLEVALAKEEMKREALAAKNAAIALAIGAVLLLLGIALLLVALALAIFPGPIPSIVLGLVLVVGAIVAGVSGLKLLPRRPLAETRERVETDIEAVKERVS